MPDVYIAPQPHFCPVPDRVWESRPCGSVWQCDDCGRYWVHSAVEEEWVPVRWWHFNARRRIREGVSGV